MLLWMEDNLTQTRDISNILEKTFSPVERYSNPSLLIDRLVELKRNDRLGTVQLMLDIMIPGTPFVTSPREWNDRKLEHYPADKGYRAGLVFYERVVLEDAANFWKPLPGVIFLTVLPPDHDLLTSSLSRIRGKAKELDKGLPDKIHVLSKGDLELENKLEHLVGNNRKVKP